MSDDVRDRGQQDRQGLATVQANPRARRRPESVESCLETDFEARLTTRYMKPIESLQASHTLNGEGFRFSPFIAASIEFLESTLQGRTYRSRRKKDPPLGQYEYTESGQMSTAFLTGRKPFSQVFNASLAVIFIQVSVRASARGADKGRLDQIKAKGRAIAEVAAGRKLVYRKISMTPC